MLVIIRAEIKLIDFIMFPSWVLTNPTFSPRVRAAVGGRKGAYEHFTPLPVRAEFHATGLTKAVLSSCCLTIFVTR